MKTQDDNSGQRSRSVHVPALAAEPERATVAAALAQLNVRCPFHPVPRTRLEYVRGLAETRAELRCPTCLATQVWEQLEPAAAPARVG